MRNRGYFLGAGLSAILSSCSTPQMDPPPERFNRINFTYEIPGIVSLHDASVLIENRPELLFEVDYGNREVRVIYMDEERRKKLADTLIQLKDSGKINVQTVSPHNLDSQDNLDDRL